MRLELVAVALLLALALGRLDADLLVVLLERRKVLAGLAELALLHTLADVPVDEGALGVHQIELVVDARHHLRDRSAVRDHAHRAHHLREVTARDDGRGLVVDTALEARRGPVHELDRALRLDRRTAAFTSFGTTSPRYIMQHAMYLPWRGSHFTIMHAGSNTLLVISATLSCSWYAFSAEMIGA